MMEDTIYIATRKSALALWQAEKVQQLLKEQEKNSELIPVVTTGDKMQHTQLSSVMLEQNQPHHLTTGKGLFIKEVQEALLSHQAHLAVHSMKDLPVEQTSGLIIGALLPRASPCDVLVISPQVLQEINLTSSVVGEIPFETLKSLLLKSKLFCTLPIGTTSSRRQFLMRNLFSSQLNLQILRGNVDSRLKKINNNEFSAILLAQAGLERLNLFDTKYMAPLPLHSFIPATAQGVIAIECTNDNKNLLRILQKLNCAETCLCTAIERTVLHLLDGDCNSSIGIHYSKQSISIIYKKAEIEKSLQIAVTLEDLEELKTMYTSTGGIYSYFIEQMAKSLFTDKIKALLLKVGLYRTKT
ncbi:MAG: hypothetical protein V4591_02650 [Bdellovibrionota bacterium]